MNSLLNIFSFSGVSYWSILALTGALGVLLYILCRHRADLLRKEAFPWKGLFFINAPKPESRKRPPPWLWLLLLALAFSGFAASMPTRMNDAEEVLDHVVILEAGVEAKSREQGGKTRFALFKESLAKLARDSAGRERYLLITAGAVPRVVGSWMNGRQLVESLRPLTPVDAAADWSAAFNALENLTGVGRYVLIIAGGRPRTRFDAWVKRSLLSPPPCIFIKKGREAPNVGVESIRIFTSPFAGDGHGVEGLIYIKCFSERSAKRRVTILFDEEALHETDIRIQGNQAFSMHIRDIPEGGVLKIMLEPDAQPSDDEARAVIPVRMQLTVGMLGAREDMDILSRLPMLNVRQIGPEEMDGLSPHEIPDIFLVDRGRVSFDAPANVNTLYYAGSGPPVRARPRGVIKEHPLCRGIGDIDVAYLKAWPDASGVSGDVAVFGVRTDLSADPGGMFFPLVQTAAPLRARRVYFAFDPFSSIDYNKIRTVPLLLVNALEWLAPGATLPPALTAGTSAPLAGIGPKALEVIRENETGDRADAFFVDAENESIPGENLAVAGIYITRFMGKDHHRFAVNPAARPIVSEKGPEIDRYHPDAPYAPGEPGNEPNTFPWWLAGLVFIVLETVVYLFASGLGRELYRGSRFGRSKTRMRRRFTLEEAETKSRQGRIDAFGSFEEKD